MANAMLEFERKLNDLRRRLDAHRLAQNFTGADITVDGHVVENYVKIGSEILAGTFARLFLLANGAQCSVEIESQQTVDKAPPGLYVKSQHDWIESYNRVGIYKVETGDDELTGVFIDNVFFVKDAPAQLGTLSFAYLALAAYEMGYHEITLLAGGGAGTNAAGWDPPGMVGYKVWPKFGFDAPLEEGETSQVASLSNCKTVREVRQQDLDWWENVGGDGRVMRFDLTPASDAWQTLLNYICGKKEFP